MEGRVAGRHRTGAAAAEGPVRRALVLAALVAALPASALASDDDPPVLVVGQGMAGVRLDMTVSEVREEVGKAVSVKKGHDTFGSTRQEYFKGPKLHVVYHGGKVTGMFSTQRLIRTPKGVGVGSTEKAVRSRVNDVSCLSVKVGKDKIRTCTVGDRLPGETVTDFVIGSDKKVRRIVVGRVLD